MSNETQIWTGNYGEVWLNNTHKLARVQNFSLKQTNKWEDVDDTDSLATQRRLIGYELTGEINKFKVDFEFNDIMEKYSKGQQPTISIVAKMTNPDTGKSKRISINDVTLNDLNIFDFEKGKTSQDTVSYNAGSYEYLD